MVTRTKCGWMALGGLLVLFGIVLACKLRDGSRALAQSEPAGPVLPDIKSEDRPTTTEPPLAPMGSPALFPLGVKTAAEPGPISTALPPPPLTPLNMPAEPMPLPEIKPVVFETPAPSYGPPEGASLPPSVGDPRPILIPASATMPSGPLPPVVEAVPPPTGTFPPPSAPANPSGPAAATKADGAIVIPPVGGLPPAGPASTPLPEVKVSAAGALKVEVKDHVDEPPLAPSPGPVVTYHVTTDGETFRTIARKTLGTVERWTDILKLNPEKVPYKADSSLAIGALVRLPGDACVADEETVKALPALRGRMVVKVKTALPLTGTYPVTLDDHKVMTLPQAILKQLGACDTVMVSPGSDKCLWLTNQAHLDRLAQKLEKSPARESDKNGFRRLYFAQTLKVPMKDGRVAIADKLAAFAGLHQEVVLVGIDDHFEVWDAARWRRYTQARKATSIEE